MATKEDYNSLVLSLAASIIESGEIKATDKIVCITNDNSLLPMKLVSAGYTAKEVGIKDFDGDCDVLILFLGYRDVVRVLEKTKEHIKILNLYRKLLGSSDTKTQEIIDSFFVKSIGTSENIIEIFDGKERVVPFDNKVFIYNFGGT